MLILVLFFADHPANAFVDKQLLVRLQIFQILRQVCDDALDEGFIITIINLHEHLFCQFSDLEIRLTCHVLHTRVNLMHKLVQLIHHSLQEGPVIDQETWELPYNIHDVRGNEGLCIFC